MTRALIVGLSQQKVPAGVPIWAALHGADGRELAPQTAPGYRRAPIDLERPILWPTAEGDWGWICFVSVWDAPLGGRCVSQPALQPVGGGQRIGE